VDEYRHAHRLVAVSLEGFQLIELERTIQLLAPEAVCLEMGCVAGEPSKAMLDRATRNPEGSGALALTYTRHHKVEKRRVKVRFLMEIIRAKSLAGKGFPAGATSETLHRVVPAAWKVKAMTPEEA
jgi:hypothetical protein